MVDGIEGNGGIDLTVLGHGFELERVVLAQAQLDLRVRLLEARQKRCEKIGTAEWGTADGHDSPVEMQHVIDVLMKLFIELEDMPGVFEVQLPNFRWLERIRAAVEKRCAEFLFDAGDELGKRRLRNKEFLRGAGHRAFPGDGADIVKLTEFHREPPSGCCLFILSYSITQAWILCDKFFFI